MFVYTYISNKQKYNLIHGNFQVPIKNFYKLIKKIDFFFMVVASLGSYRPEGDLQSTYIPYLLMRDFVGYKETRVTRLLDKSCPVFRLKNKKKNYFFMIFMLYIKKENLEGSQYVLTFTFKCSYGKATISMCFQFILL